MKSHQIIALCCAIFVTATADANKTVEDFFASHEMEFPSGTAQKMKTKTPPPKMLNSWMAKALGSLSGYEAELIRKEGSVILDPNVATGWFTRNNKERISVTRKVTFLVKGKPFASGNIVLTGGLKSAKVTIAAVTRKRQSIARPVIDGRRSTRYISFKAIARYKKSKRQRPAGPARSTR